MNVETMRKLGAPPDMYAWFERYPTLDDGWAVCERSDWMCRLLAMGFVNGPDGSARGLWQYPEAVREPYCNLVADILELTANVGALPALDAASDAQPATYSNGEIDGWFTAIVQQVRAAGIGGIDREALTLAAEWAESSALAFGRAEWLAFGAYAARAPGAVQFLRAFISRCKRAIAHRKPGQDGEGGLRFDSRIAELIRRYFPDTPDLGKLSPDVDYGEFNEAGL